MTSIPSALVNGIDIHYREVGDGFPVVFIHGYTGNLRNWNGQLTLRRQHRLIAADLPGHGHSAKPEDAEAYGLGSMAEAVYGLINHLELGSLCIVGHSMGGMVAQELALSHPGDVSALVLVDTSAEPVNGLRTSDRERLMEIARTEGMEAVFEAEIARTAPNESADVIRMWRQQFLLTGREAFIYCADTIAGRPSLLHRLAEISAPVLVICGEDDQPFLEPSRRMSQTIPGSELIVIPGSGHSPQMEKPNEFNEALSGFLGDLAERNVVGGQANGR